MGSFLASGWQQFAEANKIKRGNHLTFVIDEENANAITLHVTKLSDEYVRKMSDVLTGTTHPFSFMLTCIWPNWREFMPLPDIFAERITLKDDSILNVIQARS